MSRRSRIVGFGSAGLLVLAGAACAALVSGGLGQILALVLISLGCVEAVSLVFLEIGYSEDRDRARAEQARRRVEESQRKPRAARPRLHRTRGHPRRLR